MAYKKKGYNPNSLANLHKGSNLPKLATTDCKSQEIAELILNEEVEYNGAMVTMREVLLREQVEKALEGDLRSCQFIIELAGRSEQLTTAANAALLSPLEELQAKMLPPKLDNRRVDNCRRKGEKPRLSVCSDM